MISGPSGGGKTTVVEQMQRRLPGLVRSVSVTTRAPRRGERTGRDYRFISLPTFMRLRRSGNLLEWALVHGAYYGTPKQPVMRALNRGRNVLLSIDVQGARQVQRTLRSRAVLIFLLPPSLRRLRARLMRRRTETPEKVRQRLSAAKREIESASWYDYRIVNDRLDRTVREVGFVINKERGNLVWRKETQRG